ncbi:diguanylate cyclase [Methyloglobulus sp.]|jgi:diguanylate cyclase (GGDEF)-like protein|uniref:GGDEF domain-containing response regulator n=1 Tax=Methyloglobulus sp. TaxID=2518622 RepID=UPI0032B76C7A
MKILVVDTDKISRMIVDECVSALGHETHHAENGKYGLAYARENNIDLIFMGDEMSDLNGSVATRVIRAFKKDEWIPIIFLTTRPHDEFYTYGLLAGADACLQKPLNPYYLQLQVTAMERLCIMRRKLLAQKSLVKANQYLLKIAMIDQLTKLGNRRNFEHVIVREFNLAKREKTSFSLLMCDIDHFKVYNDRYGHQEGDKCLKKIAETILETLTRPADIACRFGGDEFVVILPRTDAAGGLQVAEKIRQAVYDINMILVAPKDIRVTLSIGVANFSGQYTNTEELVEIADKALYEAKNTGRNRSDLSF